jgi:hypothetical protein
VPQVKAAPPLADAFVAAFDAEAVDPSAAGLYLDAIDKAAADPAAPGALETVVASIDALVLGATPGLELTEEHAIAFRSRDGMPSIVERLRKAWLAIGEHVERAGAAGGAPAAPFIRGIIANGLHRLALYTGEEQPASVWVQRRGCAAEASIIGPLDAMALVGIEGPSPVRAVGAPLAESYRGIAPFGAAIRPEIVKADACELDVNATSFLQGSRAAVIDIDNPSAQRVSFALTTSAAAVVEVGGVVAIRRGYEAGGGAVMRLATVELPAGRARVVVRVAQKGDGNLIELDVWDEEGLPMLARAPRPGDVADVRGGRVTAVEFAPLGRRDADLSLAAAALLGLGEGRTAEHMLELAQAKASGQAAPAAAASPKGDAPATPTPKSKPSERALRLELLYARAIAAAEDVPEIRAVERTRSALARVIAGWPASWEARIGQARLAERRRGAGEGVIAALSELGISVPPSPGGAEAEKPLLPVSDELVLTYAALLANRMRLVDVAEAAYAALEKKAPGSTMLAQVDAQLHGRIGAEGVKAACSGGLSRAGTDCLEAHRDRGDHKAALAELGRLRRLRSSAEALRELELVMRVQNGDIPGALAIHDALPPAQRRLLDALGLAAGKGLEKEVRERFGREAVTARDAPYGISPLVRVLGLEPDPAPPLEAEGRKLVLQDMVTAFLPGAATAVLRHLESYTIDATGLVRFTTYDLRRVSGTTDVERGAISFGPMIEGRGAPRLLRRRIHKRDGRVLEPDAAANAAQFSDLSQLEQGDYVEQIIEGWALPNDSGQIVIDTPDLLPERTSVREAEIELRRAASIPFSLWSHPLLGAAEERAEGGLKVSVWRLKGAPPRRIEDGMPRLERSVGISIGTQTWENIARALDENIRSLEDRDPYISRFARELAAEAAAEKGASAQPEAPTRRALVERVVAAVGKKVKLAGGGELSDIAAMYGGGSQRTTARTILELGQGSRSWVIYRVLRELGIPAELAVAETEPFSVAPSFPPHVGRFRHPLVVARLGGAEGELWIDSDVEGPPLPPGRISPELRGRSAMLAGGQIVTAPSATGETGDEIDVRLKLDAKGDAEGSFTILLHGRPAQALAEAFETVVGTERREMLRGVVLGWLPWADVEEVVVSSTEGSWEVALRASIKIHGYASPEGQDGKTWVLPGLEPVHLVFPRSFASTLGATYASRGARQSALLIDTALQYHVRRRVELPPGATVARAPEGASVADAGLSAARKGTYGAVIEEDFTLNLPTGTVSAEAYPGFVEKVRAIDDSFMAGTRVRVKP